MPPSLLSLAHGAESSLWQGPSKGWAPRELSARLPSLLLAGNHRITGNREIPIGHSQAGDLLA